MNGQDYVTAACMTLRSAAVHLWRRHKAGDLLLLAFHLLFCLLSLHINVLLSVPEWIRYAATLWLSLKIWFPPIHVIATLICSNAILTDLTPSCAHPTNSRSNYFLCLMFALLCWLFHIAHPGEDAGNGKHSHNYVIGNRSVNFQWISAFALFPGLKYPIIRTQPPVPLRGSVQHQQHTAPTQERVHTHQRIREDDTEASLPDQQSITELSHSSQHCLQITFLLLRIFFPPTSAGLLRGQAATYCLSATVIERGTRCISEATWGYGLHTKRARSMCWGGEASASGREGNPAKHGTTEIRRYSQQQHSAGICHSISGIIWT